MKKLIKRILKEEIDNFDWIHNVPITIKLGELINGGRIQVGDTLVLRGELINDDNERQYFPEFKFQVVRINHKRSVKDQLEVDVSCEDISVIDFLKLSDPTEFSLIQSDNALEVIKHIRDGEVLTEDFDWVDDVKRYPTIGDCFYDKLDSENTEWCVKDMDDYTISLQHNSKTVKMNKSTFLDSYQEGRYELLKEDFDWVSDPSTDLVQELQSKLKGTEFFVKYSALNSEFGKVIEINSKDNTGEFTLVDFHVSDVDSGTITLETIIQDISDIIDEIGFRSENGKLYQKLHDYLVE